MRIKPLTEGQVRIEMEGTKSVLASAVKKDKNVYQSMIQYQGLESEETKLNAWVCFIHVIIIVGLIYNISTFFFGNIIIANYIS